MTDQTTAYAEGNPFGEDGIHRDEHGVKHYDRLPLSLVAMLRDGAEQAADREAVVELDGPRLTYRELWDGAARVAGGLRDDGVAPGDRVAIRYGNGVDWVLAFFGIQLAGGIAVPVNTRLAEPEIAYVLGDSAAGVVLGPASSLPRGRPYAHEGLTGDQPAAIFYTSGTTGFPKGALTTHENFLTAAENGLRITGIARDDPTARNLISVPLYHVTACISQLISMLYARGTVVIVPSFTVENFLRAIPQERIRMLTTVPAIYWYVLSSPLAAEADLSRITSLSYGGAPIAPSLVRTVKAGFPNARVGNGFGLTETSAVSTYLPDEYAFTHTESVGFAVPTVDLRLHEPDPAGVGELLIRGANVVDGYWHKPAETAATFRNGWLHSGDLARIDDGGRVHILDRVKDMINRGGENVYSVEVENCLAGAPGVVEVAVIGVPDVMMGEKVGAVIVGTPGTPVDETAILTYARDRIADFKVPQYLHVRSEPLPRNPGGKVLKSQLRREIPWTLPG